MGTDLDDKLMYMPNNDFLSLFIYVRQLLLPTLPHNICAAILDPLLLI